LVSGLPDQSNIALSRFNRAFAYKAVAAFPNINTYVLLLAFIGAVPANGPVGGFVNFFAPAVKHNQVNLGQVLIQHMENIILPVSIRRKPCGY